MQLQRNEDTGRACDQVSAVFATADDAASNRQPVVLTVSSILGR